MSQPDKSASELQQSYKEWEHKVDGMKDATRQIDWSTFDFSKLKPKDIGVHIGPMMTEEQFREYRQRSGSNVHVLKGPK